LENNSEEFLFKYVEFKKQLMSFEKLLTQLKEIHQAYQECFMKHDLPNLSFNKKLMEDLILELIKLAEYSVQSGNIKTAIKIYTLLLRDYLYIVEKIVDLSVIYFSLFILILEYYGASDNIMLILSQEKKASVRQLIQIFEKYCDEFGGFSEIYRLLADLYKKLGNVKKEKEYKEKALFSPELLAYLNSDD